VSDEMNDAIRRAVHRDPMRWAAEQAGLPLELADRLVGTTDAELRADAERLAGALGEHPTSGPSNGGFDPGARESVPGPGPSMDQLVRRAAGRSRSGWAGQWDPEYPHDDGPGAA
jgi:hypothetical protein